MPKQVSPLPLPSPLFFHVPETRGFLGCPVSGALECPTLNLVNQKVQNRTFGLTLGFPLSPPLTEQELCAGGSRLW